MPTATYRLQVQPAFTFEEAAAQADYLAALGVSHAYLSPVLQAAPASTHGYDVVDHSRISEEAGGREAFDAMVAGFHDAGLGVVVDVVPNHMTTPTPAWLNQQWWSLLRDGRDSPHAHWFDVDWEAEDGRVLLPVLGAELDAVLAAGELHLEPNGGPDGEPVLRYHDHVFPVAPGSDSLALSDLVAAQAYRLCHWREGGERLNYRRFFDVSSLVAVRVEDAEVFEATHRPLVDLVATGAVDGLRIDHPDGLADPKGYLDRLAAATGGAWVVVEKILEGHEELPLDWHCAGTTGYDALMRVGGVFVDPAGAEPLTEVWSELAGTADDLGQTVLEAKQQVVRDVLPAEVNRLMRLLGRIVPGHDQSALHRALVALLVSMDRYRAYVDPERPAPPEAVEVLDAAARRAQDLLEPHEHESLVIVRDLVLGQGEAVGEPEAMRELIVRFQQTCGPVMAKGLEDTAFYRFARLTALNEVGGDPARVGVEPAELHEFAARRLAAWPVGMTALSTHDTKRSEDVRARLGVLSELPQEWGSWFRQARRLAARHRDPLLDGPTEYLLWQAAVGAWPIGTDRLQAYATKAIREAKQWTTWTDQNDAYERAVARFVDGITTDPAITAHLASWAERTSAAARVAILGQKLLQLVLPGVPDVYQGTETVDLSLVDPDNRRLVDYGTRRDRLDRLDRGSLPEDLDDAKLLVASRTLRLRRDHPEWFVGEHASSAPITTTSEHALALGRGADRVEVVAVVTRLPERLAARGGWGEASVQLPEPGTWRDVLTDRNVETDGTGLVRLAELLGGALPVVLLCRRDRLGSDELD